MTVLFIAVLAVAAAVGGASLSGYYASGEYSAYGLEKLYETDGIAYRDYKTFIEANGTVETAVLARASLKDLRGETVMFAGTKEDFEREIERLGVTVLERQTLGGIEIAYGYTDRLKGGIEADGKKINVQLAYRGGTVTVGSPVILGSY